MQATDLKVLRAARTKIAGVLRRKEHTDAHLIAARAHLRAAVQELDQTIFSAEQSIQRRDWLVIVRIYQSEVERFVVSGVNMTQRDAKAHGLEYAKDHGIKSVGLRVTVSRRRRYL
jgi:hypothetical protein